MNISREFCKLLTDGDSFILTTHARPDGDGLGCLAAMCGALGRGGKSATPILLSPVPPKYGFIFDKLPAILGQDISAADLPTVDSVLVIDTSARGQITTMLDWLDRFAGSVGVIDHHQPGDLRFDAGLIDTTASASGVIVAELLEQLGWLDDPEIASDLLVAIGSDTGWFRYANTNARVLRWAGRLAELGANVSRLYAKLFLSEVPERLGLLARALGSLELFCDGRVAAMCLTMQDFADCGAGEHHTENIVDEASRIGSVQASALFVQQGDGLVKVSLRSGEQLDVHQLAQKHGGGGHRQAAGCKLTGSVQQVKEQIISELEQMFSDQHQR